MLVYIYTDGAARGNPGPSASGYNIFDRGHKLVFRAALYNGVKTNNFAEYMAVITALEKVGKELGFDNDIELYSDSQIVVRQLNGEYKVKDAKMRALRASAMELLDRFRSHKLENVRRSNRYIVRVDAELNQLLDRLESKESKYQKGYNNSKEISHKGSQRRL